MADSATSNNHQRSLPDHNNVVVVEHVEQKKKK